MSSVEHMRHFPFEKSSLSSDDSGVKQSLPFITLKFSCLRDEWQRLPGGLPLSEEEPQISLRFPGPPLLWSFPHWSL